MIATGDNEKALIRARRDAENKKSCKTRVSSYTDTLFIPEQPDRREYEEKDCDTAVTLFRETV